MEYVLVQMENKYETISVRKLLCHKSSLLQSDYGYHFIFQVKSRFLLRTIMQMDYMQC